MDDRNIFSLHQLSIKYDVPKLTEITNEYIKEHDLDLIFDIIQYKLSLFEKKEKEEEFENNFDTEEEEKKIATDFLNTSDEKNWFLFQYQFYIESSTKYKMKLKTKMKKKRKN